MPALNRQRTEPASAALAGALLKALGSGDLQRIADTHARITAHKDRTATDDPGEEERLDLLDAVAGSLGGDASEVRLHLLRHLAHSPGKSALLRHGIEIV